MGTWNTQIDANDSFQDIYQNFFGRYNQGQSPAYVSERILADFSDAFNDHEDQYNSLFGLAMAQWETKSLDKAIQQKVKEIIENGSDLELWKELGADEKTIKQREKALNKFQVQISVEKDKPKRRVRPKFEFEMINLLDAPAPDSLKKFTINQEYRNKNYIHTGGVMHWRDGGGSVFYFTGEGKNISAKWLGSQMLEVTHDKDIVFTIKWDRAFYCGDEVKVIYIEK